MSWNGSGSKGQIPQLFIILMALLVIGATLFLGFKMFGTLGAVGCEANNVAFIRDIKTLLDENAVYGTRATVTLRPPCDAVALCFVDNAAIGTTGFQGNDSVITASVRSGVQTNIFLQGRDKTEPQGFDGRIAIDPPERDICVLAVGGKFTFRAEGQGRTIKLSKVS